MRKTTAILLVFLLLLGLVHPTDSFVSAMYGTKTIDGNLNDWTASDLIAVGQDTGLAGANLDRLYVAWDDQYLYIAIKTNNTEHWNTVLGVGIDIDPGTGNGYVGADQDGDPSNGFEDIWWRNIGFGGGYAIDYELYFWYDSGNQRIGGGDFKHWNGNGWDDVGIGNVKYASSPDPSFGTVELAIPWEALGGRPEKIALIAWLAGDGAHSSAIDTLPVDPDVDYPTAGDGEWTDGDILTSLAEISVAPKTIDGDLNDWDTSDIVVVGHDNGLAGANLDKMYISWDDQYLYIAIKTNNTEKWWPDYGIAIDVDPGSGNGGTTDPWAKNIQFSGQFLPDYIIYAEAQNGEITWMGMHDWTGSGWGSMGNVKDIGDYAYVGGDQGIQTIEIKIPWSALGGKRSKFAIISWIAGNNDGDSAVDTLPIDPAIDYSNINSEWTDQDILTNMFLCEWFLMADLTASITGPTIAGLNRTTEYRVTVKNLGSLPASDAEVRAYVNDTLISNWTVDLGAGEERELTFTWKPNETGRYTLKVTVDEDNLIEEANEDNNVITMDVDVVWVGKIEVDGNPDDWPTAELSNNTYDVVSGTFIWKDAENDHRTDKDIYLSETDYTSSHADLTEVAVTKDDHYVYFLFKFRNMSNMKLGANGATFIAVPIDYRDGGKAGRFAGSMDTGSVIEWDIQMAVNLKCSGCTGDTAVMPAGNSVESMLYFIDPDNNIVTVNGAVVAVNLTANTVEVKVPVEVFGGATKFSFQVATGLSWGGGVWNFGDPFNDDDISDAVDVLSDKPTKDEVLDGYLDYYIKIETNGIVKEANAVDYTLVRRKMELQEFWGNFIALNRYYGVWHFKNDYERYLELREYFENATLPDEIAEKVREYEDTVTDLLKLYNEGKESIDKGNAAFGASLKIFRAYTGLKRVLKEMEALKVTVEEGNFEKLQHLEELSKNLTKTIDGNLDDWSVPQVAVDEAGYGQDGADLKALYVDYDDQFLYIALTTENRASWRIAYGISLDYKDGGYTGDQDSWGKKVSFSRGIDAQLYFFWNGEFFGDPGTSTITSAQLVLWNGTGWEYKDLQLVGFYAYTGGAEDGLQTLEIAIPWEALGVKPGEINIVAYVTGQGAGDSAVDSLPLQDAVKDTEPGQEWGDADTFTQFATVTTE
ncbi:hypothetical protein TEU_02800 [Thermococcus eurythermalis]|uniref:CARDB domain-containing protein n=1 Tax=Thermococcus eurythermalis TaxID=1505907 RepID=A0A097QSA7_9EURY|nr:CARDB domain-containing protein [Thermococcus eurythermalis]AIU69358.1 hypothetical protein TEU_02800 [Thermococcus eurythermalis]